MLRVYTYIYIICYKKIYIEVIVRDLCIFKSYKYCGVTWRLTEMAKLILFGYIPITLKERQLLPIMF